MNDVTEAIRIIVDELSTKNIEIAELRQKVYDLEDAAAKRNSNICKIYMSPKEALERYSIGMTTLYELFAMPQCPNSVKIGSKRLIPIAAFDAFISDTFSENFMDGKVVKQAFNN